MTLKNKVKIALKARGGTLMLVSVLIALAALVIYFLGIYFHLFSMPSRPNGYSGKFIGKMVGLTFLGIVFGLSYIGLGKNLIEKYLQEFEQMDAVIQEAESKKGLRYFLIPFFVLLGTILLFSSL